jgi:hypothetical protein
MREDGNVTYWLAMSGTTEEPHIHEDWRPRENLCSEQYGDVWKFSRRPRIVPGDRLVSYAVGSPRRFGKGRVLRGYVRARAG